MIVKTQGYQGKWYEVISVSGEQTATWDWPYKWETWVTVVDDNGNNIKICIGSREPNQIAKWMIGKPCTKADEYHTKIICNGVMEDLT